MPTCGKWYYRSCGERVFLQFDKAGHFEGKGNLEDYKVAYHGTALSNVYDALIQGIEPGMMHFEDLYGVYCEGEHRQSSVFNYMTHESLDSENPFHLYAAMFELCVDRSVGRTRHCQWIQPKDSVFVTGVYIHVFNFLDFFSPTAHGGTMAGWLRVSEASMESLLTFQLCINDSDTEATATLLDNSHNGDTLDPEEKCF